MIIVGQGLKVKKELRACAHFSGPFTQCGLNVKHKVLRERKLLGCVSCVGKSDMQLPLFYVNDCPHVFMSQYHRQTKQ